MNVKTLAALVGTLSLGTLATGCASTRATAGESSQHMGGEAACKGLRKSDTQERGGEAASAEVKSDAAASCRGSNGSK